MDRCQEKCLGNTIRWHHRAEQLVAVTSRESSGDPPKITYIGHWDLYKRTCHAWVTWTGIYLNVTKLWCIVILQKDAKISFLWICMHLTKIMNDIKMCARLFNCCDALITPCIHVLFYRTLAFLPHKVKFISHPHWCLIWSLFSRMFVHIRGKAPPTHAIFLAGACIRCSLSKVHEMH